MAEALVSLLVDKLSSIMLHELEQEVRLVVGVENEVEKLTSNLTAIQAVLADAETKQVKEASVRDWLEKLKDVAYDIEDALDDWEAAILSSQSKPGDGQDSKQKRKVCSFLRSSCFCCKQVGLQLRYDIANKIKELNESLDRIAQERERYHFDPKRGNPTIERLTTTSKIDITEVKGREEDKSKLANMLLSDSSDGARSNLRVLSIVGIGGIGKTTLAKFAFNHDSIKTYFNKKIWVCVSNPFDEMMVAEAILESLLDGTPNVKQLQGLLDKIGESIKEKKFLLVLDDVWEENSEKWDRLKEYLSYGSPGSKVLVTTRNEKVASVMGCSEENILKVRILSDEECWLIARKTAFLGRGNTECKSLEEIGKKISKKCKGLPLAAKAVGGILQFRKSREEWQSILDSAVWEFDEVQRDVIAPLLLSYYDLSPALKRCFSYCVIFPKDYEINKKTLIEMWMAQGYLMGRENNNLEIIGESYFRNLAMRSFFQDFKKDHWNDQIINSCKMHDIVHDFTQMVARNECLSVQVNGPLESTIRSPSSKVRHLSLNFANGSSSFFNSSFKLTKKLRSLLMWGLPLTAEELSSLFSGLTHVRSLRLRYMDLEEIPSTISKLVQLRWLDLSGNWNLKKLPATICELHKLETIDITHCCNVELPAGIENLINLKHLHNRCDRTRVVGVRMWKYDPINKLPKGIAQLTGLRTLEEVGVGCDVDKFSLGDFKNLNQLRGRLFIRNLGAHNHHVGEAKEAELKKKEHLTCLELEFAVTLSGGRKEEDEHLLEALEPSPNLEILQIRYDRCATYPGWMINSLMNLRSLILFDSSCEHLPSLGKLPSLESLTLWRMLGVEKVGVELLGIQTPPQIGGDRKSQIISAASSSSSSSPVVVAFPKLSKLVFREMGNWKEWDDYYYYNDNDGTTKPPPITIMPSLRSLAIEDCPSLKALPDYILQNTMLHTLEIDNCYLLEERYNKKNGEDWSQISHISHVKISSSSQWDHETRFSFNFEI